MAAPLNASSLVTKIRRRLRDQDANNPQWSDTELLEAADDALEPIFTTVRAAGSDHELDYLTLSDLPATTLGTNVVAYQLPEFVGSVRRMKALRAGEAHGIELDRAELGYEDAAYEGLGFGIPRWIYSKGRMGGEVQIRGSTAAFPTIQLWYVRRWPPLHYGLAAASGAATLVLSPAPSGRIVKRDSLYVGIDFEITNNVPSGNQDAMRRCTAYVGSTNTATVSSNWPAIPTTSTAYAMIVPLEPEYGDWLVEMATMLILEREGNLTQLAAMRDRVAMLENRAMTGLRHRDTSRPKRVWSSRH